MSMQEQKLVYSITASGYEPNSTNIPNNIKDGNLSTRWSMSGIGQWLRLDLGDVKNISNIGIALYRGNERKTTFTVQVSMDGVAFKDVLVKKQSSGNTTAIERYPVNVTGVRYIKIVCFGNNLNLWNSITEIEVYSPISSPTENKDRFGTLLLNTPVTNGPKYESNFDNRTGRSITAVNVDPLDPIFMMRGSGKVIIHGNGIATVSGDQPRFYFTRKDKSFAPFKNTEITFYAMRVSDDNTSFAGLVAAVRSKHHLADGNNVNNIYARIRNNGKVDFAWEQNHPTATIIKSADNPLLSAGIPNDIWLGYKFVMKNRAAFDPDQTYIIYELYIDLKDGLNGGDWKLVLRYEDKDPNRISRLVNANGCAYIRNTGITDWKYKKISVYEIVA